MYDEEFIECLAELMDNLPDICIVHLNHVLVLFKGLTGLLLACASAHTHSHSLRLFKSSFVSLKGDRRE